MKTSWARLTSVFAVALLSFAAVAKEADAPKGWFLGAGGNLEKYSVTLDRESPIEGSACARLASNTAMPSEFSTLMQAAKAEPYRGKRVRISAQIKSKDVTSWSYLWLRADDASGMRLALDNMQSHPIKGANDWKLYSLVLDIPESAAVLAYGIGLYGPGTVWLDAVQIEIVDRTVPVSHTSEKGPTHPPIASKWVNSKPANLGFEE